jgi:hypothetical protein
MTSGEGLTPLSEGYSLGEKLLWLKKIPVYNDSKQHKKE